MKLLRLFTLAAVSAASMAFLSACSSSEEPAPVEEINPMLPDPDYDSRAFTEMFVPTADFTLNITEIESYRKDDLTGDKWEKYDYRELMGCSVPAPGMIIYKKGKLYTPMATYADWYGPTRFSVAFDLLVKVKVFNDWTVVIKRDFKLNEDAINISRRDFNIKNINDGNIWLTTISGYDGGRTGKGGLDLYVLNYTINGSSTDKCYSFDSVDDAYAWVIEAFKAKFGDEVNRNNYTGGAIIFDSPMFNVSMIQQELELYHKSLLRIQL